MSDVEQAEMAEVCDALRMCNASLRDENRRLRENAKDCIDVLEMCLSDKNMNISTHGGIVGCINSLRHELSRQGGV